MRAERGALGAMSGQRTARSLVDDVCTPVVVTRAGSAVSDMPVNLAGDYLEAGFTTGNRPVFYKAGNESTVTTSSSGSSSSGSVGDVLQNSDGVMYWTSGVAVAAGGGVELGSGAGGRPTLGWRKFSEPRHQRQNSRASRKKRVSRDANHHDSGGGGEDDKAVEAFLAKKQEKAEILAACTTGGWMIRESMSSYPAYLVMDCAVHPVDISSGIWYTVESRDGAAEPIDASFSMVCYAPESESDDDYWGYYSDYWGYYDSSDDSQPAPGPITNSPAVQILDLDEFPTIAPGATVDIGDATSDRGPSSSSPGVDDPLAWGSGASFPSSVTSTTSFYPQSSTSTSFESRDLDDDSAVDSSDVAAATDADGDSSESGVTEGLMISGGLFLAVTFAGVLGAVLWVGHKRRRKQRGEPVAVPAPDAPSRALDTQEAPEIVIANNNNNNNNNDDSEAEAGRYFSKPSAHDKRDVAIVTTGTTAAAAAANIYDEEKGDEGYDQEENGQDFVDAGAGGDADVPSTVDGKGEAVTAGTTAAAAATAAVGGDDGGDDVKHEGSDVLQPPPAEEEDDGQKEETAAVVPAEEPEQVVAEPEPAAETEQVEAEPEPEPPAEPEPAAEPEPEPAASPAEATATAVAEGDKELSADGEEAAPATDGAETTVVAAPASAAVESEGDGGGGSEEGGPSAAAAATPGVDKE